MIAVRRDYIVGGASKELYMKLQRHGCAWAIARADFVSRKDTINQTMRTINQEKDSFSSLIITAAILNLIPRVYSRWKYTRLLIITSIIIHHHSSPLPTPCGWAFWMMLDHHRSNDQRSGMEKPMKLYIAFIIVDLLIRGLHITIN